MHENEKMEEEFDKLVLDLGYEFDASCFFDFTRPESSFEAEVSESWFHFAATYPPSPFIVKHKWREETYREMSIASLKSNASNTGESLISNSKKMDCDLDNKKGRKHHDEMVQNTPKIKEKSVGKSSLIRSSTLMKPTASHLAKIKSASEIYSSRSVGRSPKTFSGFSETSSRFASSPLSIYEDATKRQKLDIGYLFKKSPRTLFSMNQVAHLKHQNLMLHKLSKVPRFVANTVNSRPKPTVPREPYLETAHRAQMYRFRNGPETDVNAKLKPSSSKEQLVNKNILKTSPKPPHKKSKQEPPALQKPNQDSISTSMDVNTDVQQLNSEEAPEQEKYEPAKRTKVWPLSKQKLKHPAEMISSCKPPTELFKKLSLKSEVERNAATTTRSKQLSNKGAKENVSDSFRREMSVS